MFFQQSLFFAITEKKKKKKYDQLFAEETRLGLSLFTHFQFV